MPEQYDIVGRLYVALRHEQEQHLRTIDVLRQVVAGELSAERVEVSDGGWRITPPGVIGPVSIDKIKSAAKGTE